MKFVSSTRSFALLSLSLINLAPSLSLSVDSKARNLEPRLDGYADHVPASPFPSSASATRRRKTKCSGTGIATGTYPTGSGLSPAPQNGTMPATTLPYPTSSTAAISIAQSSSNANSPIESSDQGGCKQAIVTVTAHHTVTVTATSSESYTEPRAIGSGIVTGIGAANTTCKGRARLTSTGEGAAASSGVVDVTTSSTSTITTTQTSTTSFDGIDQSTEPSSAASSNTFSAGVTEETPLPTAASSLSHGLNGTTDISSKTTLDPVEAATGTPSGPTASTSTPDAVTGGSTNLTASTPSENGGVFWAGADIDTVLRAEALPGRTFYDYDGKTVKDPIKILGDAGLNSFRVETFRGDCLGPTRWVNTDSSLDDEDDFKLDFGCISTKVETAKQAKAAGMELMQHTINQGFNIPAGMERYTYAQMVEEVQKEAKRQLQPFLAAGIVPDVILFENEGSDGFLFHEEANGHDRSSSDDELCGRVPTGKMNSYPQYAGYLKAEVIACNEAIEAAGFSTESVQYGLHSHGQYVQWKESTIHGPKRRSQTELKKSDGSPCNGPNPIPANLLAMDVAEELTIAGFSAYPDPMRPDDINSEASLRATLGRLTDTLSQLESYTKEFPRLKSLGVEYATHFKWDEDPQKDEIAQQIRHTKLMWETVKKFPNFLGMLWWEPWYCNNHWQGGQATMCHLSFGPQGSGKMGEVPTDTLKTWGSAAVSPWEKTSSVRRRHIQRRRGL